MAFMIEVSVRDGDLRDSLLSINIDRIETVEDDGAGAEGVCKIWMVGSTNPIKARQSRSQIVSLINASGRR